MNSKNSEGYVKSVPLKFKKTGKIKGNYAIKEKGGQIWIENILYLWLTTVPK